jgi:hypothetical protein
MKVLFSIYAREVLVDTIVRVEKAFALAFPKGESKIFLGKDEVLPRMFNKLMSDPKGMKIRKAYYIPLDTPAADILLFKKDIAKFKGVDFA